MRKQIFTFFLIVGFSPLCLFAQQSSTKQEELDAFFLSKVKESAQAEAWAMAGVSMASNKENTTPGLKKKLYDIFYEQRLQTAEAMLKFKLGPQLQGRLDSIMMRTDSLSRILLQQTAPLKGNSQFAAASRMRKELKLSQVQIDALTAAAGKMKQAEASFKTTTVGVKFSPKAYEAEHMPKILTEAQYVKFLLVKNNDLALKYAVSDWKELKQRGLASGLDSATSVKDMMVHNSNRQLIKDRFANDPVQYSIAIAALKNMPEPMERLKAAKRLKNPTGENVMKNSFTW
ncbi:hypothetical protein ACFQ3S_17265 [Mucilaginibacter terrae]|uniref:hypothetical protein n=1 Tax=Mucilaginibacter terrae TaxID=1955052 RepID=UPI0036340AC4